MKTKALSFALALTALALPLLPPSASAEVEVSFEYFQDALSPFGEWIEVADYGLCWRPTGVTADWTPYSDGYWAYTDAGWTWVSYEDWGGITYHYGRWVHLLDEGWVWVPDYNWGPAWVSWRSNDDYVGWAPLPPEARWEESTGFSTWVDTSYDIGPDNYRFCHNYDFGAPVLAPLLLPCAQNVTIIQTTVNITNISYYHASTVIFNGGPSFVNINRHCRHPVPALKLVLEDRAPRDSHGHASPQVLRGNQLAIFAPKVTRPVDLKALAITPRKVVGADKINRGWAGVPDLAAQQYIRDRLRKQSAGLTAATAPARPVRVDELRSVPKVGNPNAQAPNIVAKNRSGGPVERMAARPPASPTPLQAQRPAPTIDLPRSVENRGGNRVEPAPNVPRVAAPAQPRMERPVPPQPFNVPPIQRPARPAQVEAAPSPVQPAQPVSRPARPVVTQDAQNAQRAADSARQQEAAQRANESRKRQAQRIEAVRQQQEAQRAGETQAQQQREQAAAAQRQQAAPRASEVRNQQIEQQREQTRQANAVRQQQDAAQRATEQRSQQVQQHRQQAQQIEAAQRANESRNQQVRQVAAERQQQIAAQRANEARQQQAPPTPRIHEQPPQPRQAQPPQPPQPVRSPTPESDDEKKKHKAGR